MQNIGHHKGTEINQSGKAPNAGDSRAAAKRSPSASLASLFDEDDVRFLSLKAENIKELLNLPISEDTKNV